MLISDSEVEWKGRLQGQEEGLLHLYSLRLSARNSPASNEWQERAVKQNTKQKSPMFLNTG